MKRSKKSYSRDNSLFSWLHLKDAYRAVSFDGLPIAIVCRLVGLIMVMFGFRSAGDRCISEDGFKLIRQEGELILEMSWCLKYHNEGIWSEVRLREIMWEDRKTYS